MVDEPLPDRRAVLRGGLALGGGLAATTLLPAPARAVAAPVLVRAGRPAITHGIQSGDVTATSGVVWTRADRPDRMVVEVSPTSSFRTVRRFRGPLLTPDSDFTGKTLLHGLPPGQEVFYRVVLTDPDDESLRGEPLAGRLRTAPVTRRDIRFCWSGDLAGQGWGIDTGRGGFRIFEAMRRLEPDFFVLNGDTIYADNPIQPTVPLPDGSVWRNVTTPEKAKVAETLDEYRGNYRYNLLDENLRRFAAEVPQVNQWDDHEVVNNWYPGEILDDPRYTERRVDVLAARAARAFHEYTPIAPREDGRIYRVLRHGPLLDVFVLDMRTYRNANSPGRQPVDRQGILGERQLAWLKRELLASRATWKVIAADMPLGLIVPDGPVDIEAVAQGDPGRPLGRELQLADLLSFARRHRISGIVFITTDVHYAAAHHYHPSRAAFTDFDPFWEFVAGPLNAGAFGPNRLDATFGPRAVFVHAPPAPNTSPAVGAYQHFGEIAIDGSTGVLTARLREADGQVLYSVDLDLAR